MNDTERLQWYFENFRKTGATLVCRDTELDKEAFESSTEKLMTLRQKQLPKEEWTWIWCAPEHRGIPLIAVQPPGGPFHTPQAAIDALMSVMTEETDTPRG